MKQDWQGDDCPPGRRKRSAELAWALSRLWRGWGHLRPRGPAHGQPALVIPGFLANDRTTLPLRKALAEAGWRVHGWGCGWNLRVRADTLDMLQRCLDRMEAKEPVLLVGWSLGGLYARELARHCPDRVRAVVTLGSPFSGDLHQNNVWRLYELVAGHKIEETPIQPIPKKPPRPHLALWSRQDGIVAPRTAYGFDGERDHAVELNCTHMAFAMSRKAARQVVQEIDRFLKELP